MQLRNEVVVLIGGVNIIDQLLGANGCTASQKENTIAKSGQVCQI